MIKNMGMEERFFTNKETVPGVFMFKVSHPDIDLHNMKKHFYDHGIHCSVFYGEEAFYIPCHQRLGEKDMDYFSSVMKVLIS